MYDNYYWDAYYYKVLVTCELEFSASLVRVREVDTCRAASGTDLELKE